MKKIKITFSISQKLSGHIKNVCVIARNVDQCWNKINRALNGESFSVEVLKVEEVDENFPSGFIQADSQVVVRYKNVASVIPGAALPDNNFQSQSHK